MREFFTDPKFLSGKVCSFTSFQREHETDIFDPVWAALWLKLFQTDKNPLVRFLSWSLRSSFGKRKQGEQGSSLTVWLRVMPHLRQKLALTVTLHYRTHVPHFLNHVFFFYGYDPDSTHAGARRLFCKLHCSLFRMYNG